MSNSNSTSSAILETTPPAILTTETTSDSTSDPTRDPTSEPTAKNTQDAPKPIVITTSASGKVVTIFSTYTSEPKATSNSLPLSTPTQLEPSTSDSLAPDASSAAVGSDVSTGRLNGTTTVVVAVVVPIIGVALIAIALLFFWKKRRRDKENTEKRRKEVEDYGYNPNSPPTAVLGSGGVGGGSNGEDIPYDAVEDSVGYRGWGSTNGGRKVSNMGSSIATSQQLSTVGMAFSEGNFQENSGGYNGMTVSPSTSTFPAGTAPSTDGNISNAPLITTPGNGSGTANSSVVATTGPQASVDNDGIHRGISNASSNYSTVTRSDQSDSGLPPGHYDSHYYGADGVYDDGHNYSGHPYQQYPDAGGYPAPPVIREVQARRNTQIETPTNTHFPQQGNSGIAQNF